MRSAVWRKETYANLVWNRTTILGCPARSVTTLRQTVRWSNCAASLEVIRLYWQRWERCHWWRVASGGEMPVVERCQWWRDASGGEIPYWIEVVAACSWHSMELSCRMYIPMATLSLKILSNHFIGGLAGPECPSGRFGERNDMCTVLVVEPCTVQCMAWSCYSLR